MEAENLLRLRRSPAAGDGARDGLGRGTTNREIDDLPVSDRTMIQQQKDRPDIRPVVRAPSTS